MRLTIHMQGMEFDDQFEMIATAMNQLPIVRLAIDRTGLGMQLAENAIKLFPDRAVSMAFTNPTKIMLATEAKKLVETYKHDDPEYGEASVVLLRAQVYTFHATKNRGLMRAALAELASRDPNQVAPFVQPKGVHPEIRNAALEALQLAGYQTRPKTKQVRQ